MWEKLTQPRYKLSMQNGFAPSPETPVQSEHLGYILLNIFSEVAEKDGVVTIDAGLISLHLEVGLAWINSQIT